MARQMQFTLQCKICRRLIRLRNMSIKIFLTKYDSQTSLALKSRSVFQSAHVEFKHYIGWVSIECHVTLILKVEICISPKINFQGFFTSPRNSSSLKPRTLLFLSVSLENVVELMTRTHSKSLSPKFYEFVSGKSFRG